jgi:hypothetical protein
MYFLILDQQGVLQMFVQLWGTGEIGITTLIWALNAVTIANPKERNKFLVRLPFSTQLIAIFLEGNVSMFIS